MNLLDFRTRFERALADFTANVDNPHEEVALAALGKQGIITSSVTGKYHLGHSFKSAISYPDIKQEAISLAYYYFSPWWKRWYIEMNMG